jgi:putative membrane protein
MDWIIGALVSLVVSAVLFFLLSKLPLGIEVDGMDKAAIAAVVFAVLNALASPLQGLLHLWKFEWVLFPVIFLVNVAIFGLTAKLVEGFRLRDIWSAILGALAFAFANSIVVTLLGVKAAGT